MRKSKFSEHLIIAILKSGGSRRDCKKESVVSKTSANDVLQWKSKYGGMEATDVKLKVRV